MDTDKLIAALAEDAAPVRPLPSPAGRLGRWLLAATSLLVFGVLAFGPRDDLASAVLNPRFLLTGVLALATATAAAVAALRLAVPGAERNATGRWLPLALLTAWCAAMLTLVARQGFLWAGSLAWPWALCIVKVAALSAAPSWVLFAMVRRAAPLRLRWASALAGLAGLALGSLSVQLVCTNWHAGHLFVTHYAPVVALTGVFALFGWRWLRWAPRVIGRSR